MLYVFYKYINNILYIEVEHFDYLELGQGAPKIHIQYKKSSNEGFRIGNN